MCIYYNSPHIIIDLTISREIRFYVNYDSVFVNDRLAA